MQRTRQGNGAASTAEKNLFPPKKLVQVIRPEKICVGVFGILEGVFGIWNVYLVFGRCILNVQQS